MKIEVTAEDIAEGAPGECDRCPIALACLRAGLDFVQVGDDGIEWDGGFALLPVGGLEFISAFDRGKPVEPFSFDLDVTP